MPILERYWLHTLLSFNLGRNNKKDFKSIVRIGMQY